MIVGRNGANEAALTTESGGEGPVAHVPLGSEITVNTTYARSQAHSDSARLADGNFIVTWIDADFNTTAGRFLSAQVYSPDGAPVGGELTLASLNGGIQPSVAGLAGGGWVVAWLSLGSMAAQVFDAQGAAIGPAFTVTPGSGVSSINRPDVAALAGGGFAVVWDDARTAGADVSGSGVHLRVFGATGTPVGGDVLVNAATSRNQADASIAALADGGYVVTWTDRGASAGWLVKAQLFASSGAKIGTEFVVNTATGYISSVESSVTTLANGNFAIAWYESGSTSAHHVQVFTPAGVRVGPETSVASNLGGTQVGPVITALADGGYAVAWTRDGAGTADASGRAIYVQVYGADGQANGEPRLVNSQTNGDQLDPTIVGLANGKFAISWTDLNAAGADDDQVKAQIFGAQTGAPNAAPAIVSNGGGTSASLSIDEGQTAITTVVATDEDGPEPVHYSITGGPDAALFAIDAVSGVLSLVAAPDYEAPADAWEDNFYSVTVTASDGELSSWQSIQVSVRDINEGLAITSDAGQETASISILENRTAVTIVQATDADGDAVTYSIAGGADGARFVIDAQTGALSFARGPDFEAPDDSDADNVYDVTVRAGDGEFSDDQALSVTVQAVAEGVAITSAATVLVGENANAAAFVTATDEDGDPITYAIAGGADSSRFAIDPTSGALSFLAAPNFEAPGDADHDNNYQLEVTASDGEFVASQALTIVVGNVNEGMASDWYGHARITVENRTSVGLFTATDLDGDAVTYSITDGDDADLFTIDPVTGALSFLVAPDYENPTSHQGGNSYRVFITASDGSISDERGFNIIVTNENEALSITSLGGGATASVTALENGVSVTPVTAVDPDGTAPYYAIIGGADAARFAINSNGLLYFRAAPDHEAPGDVGGDNVYEVIVSASDGSLSDSQAIAVTIGNVNEPVAISSHGGREAVSLSTGENGTSVTQVTASDLDGTPVSFSIAGGPDASRFTVDANSGALSFVAAPDYEAPADSDGDNIYQVIVVATDGAFSDSQSFSVKVGNVNEAIAITSDGGGGSFALSVAENGRTVTTVAAADPDGGPIVYAIAGGADAARFSIDAKSGALTFVSAPDHEARADAGANNVYDVIVSASDGSFTDSQALAVTVTNVREGNTIYGTASNNTISDTTTITGQPRATQFEDTIYGLDGGDSLSGAGGDDIIDGGAGNDVIYGGIGADVLTGGIGADQFVYKHVSESVVGAVDVITDFVRAKGDKVSLNAIDANVNANGNQNFSFIGTAAFSNVPGQLRFEHVGGNTFVSGDVNGDGVADIHIRLDGLIPLLGSDFQL